MNLRRAVALFCLAQIPLAACGGDEADDHGVVRVLLLRADPDEDPFVGTATAQLTLEYNECLDDFYKSSSPEWAQDGEKGGPVFQEWVDRLCDRDVYTASPACSIESIRQNFGSANSTLRVVYNIEDANLTRKELTFGPLPREVLTDGCEPRVTLLQASVQGFDAAGSQIWVVESFDNFNTAATDTRAAIQVDIGRVDMP